GWSGREACRPPEAGRRRVSPVPAPLGHREKGAGRRRCRCRRWLEGRACAEDVLPAAGPCDGAERRRICKLIGLAGHTGRKRKNPARRKTLRDLYLPHGRSRTRTWDLTDVNRAL